ncbi:MAG: diacylglyceryl transferase [Chlorobi bacterium]|nr:diacylglyceryl transferase [Chlorobiota bacterium]
MYPRLSDLINDLFGTHIILPVQSYGFFLAIAFVTGTWLLYKELDRKEKEGLLKPTIRKILKGQPASVNDLIITFVISLLVGYKIGGMILDYTSFVTDPQDFILSIKGSWWLGFLFAAAYTYYIYYKKNSQKLEKPVWEEITVHAREHALPVLFIAVIGGIVGSKIFNWFENWDDFIKNPLTWLTSFSGMNFYGGLIAAYLAALYYAHRQNINWKNLSDAAAPALILAYGIGRIGCHVAGDGDWGIVNTAPKPGWMNFLPDWLWSYNYPHNIINEGILIPGCTGQHCHQLAQPVFPTPVYETLMAIAIFIILWSIRKKIKIPGVLFSIYLMFNGIERILIEKIRVNARYDLLGMSVTQAEVISTLIFITGLSLFIILGLNYKKKTS